jgi:branched-chain amino acid transport system substrate-binding protein
MRKIMLIGLVWLLAGAMSAVYAADVIKVGQLTALSGNAANAGQHAKAAVALAVEIINGAHPELAPLPLAATAGLPNLGGAKIEVVVVDHQGNPSVGQSLALRLINQDKVVAIEGAYHSSVAFATTAVAERYGIPYVVGDSVAVNITTRGFKYVFRTTPIAPTFGDNYMEFLDDMKKAGRTVKTVAVVHENTDYGTSVGEVVVAAAKEHGFDVVADVAYNANATDVSPQVLQMKQKNPDAVVFVSYTQDAILYMKSMKALDFHPQMVIGDDAGFSDPSFVKTVGDISQGVMNRSAWDIGKPGSVTYKLNEMYKASTGDDLDDPSGRTMQAFFVLADAINRAGSTSGDAIRKALVETNMPARQLFMGYKGVKFDETGQNVLAATYLTQLQGEHYVAVWPADRAAAPVQWPWKAWMK